MIAVRELATTTNAGLAAVKWLALALMVVDHVDAFAFDRTLTWAGLLGRLVFPMFAVVIAYNLARPGALVVGGMGERVLMRCLAFGVLALPFHLLLTGGHALNIMFTFAVAVFVLRLWVDGHHAGAVAAFVLGGACVEYWWPGVGLVLASVAYFRAPGAATAGLVVLLTGSLAIVNGSHAALWALPVAVLASRLTWPLPRAKWTFWAFYPAHLAAFVVSGV